MNRSRFATLALGGLAAGLALVGIPAAAEAHPSETSAVLLTVHESEVDLALQIPLDRYTLATDSDVDATEDGVEAAATAIEEYVADHLTLTDENGEYSVEVETVSLGTVNDLPTILVEVEAVPAGESVGEVVLDYDAVSERIATHDVYVSVVSDFAGGTLPEGEPELLAVLTTTEHTVALDRGDASFWTGVGSTVVLGMRHIAEGTDHLLFLAMLLLPAPLIASGRGLRARWQDRRQLAPTLKRAGLIVSAFTVGHSLTLAAVSLGLLTLPAQPIEVLVAVSIAVAAVHVIRPLLPRGEVWIAGLFGLVHGAAFATTILELDLDAGTTIAAVLGFNVGVELAQLIAIAIVLPFLVMMSRSRAYAGVRVALAGFAVVAAAGWTVGVVTGGDSVLQPVFDLIASHPVVALAILASASAGLWAFLPVRSAVTVPADPIGFTRQRRELGHKAS
ncbi:HupE/UreJ family protein [Okibacterium endophyticum]